MESVVARFYYYGARYYNPRESVWLSADPLSGYNPIFETEHYIDGQHNGGVYNSFNHNTYGYTYQSPVVLIDPNGKQAFFMHGTWSNKYDFMSESSKNNVARIFSNTAKYSKNWSGDNTMSARLQAAKEQFNFILSKRKEGESITLVGHSHGGNVAILTANMLDAYYNGEVPINLVTINTPVRSEYQVNSDNTSVTHYNIYNTSDIVQVSGGTDTEKNGKVSKAGRTYSNAVNIEYKDQIKWRDTSGCGVTAHCGTANENVTVWYPKLEHEIKLKQKD